MPVYSERRNSQRIARVVPSSLFTDSSVVDKSFSLLESCSTESSLSQRNFIAFSSECGQTSIYRLSVIFPARLRPL